MKKRVEIIRENGKKYLKLENKKRRLWPTHMYNVYKVKLNGEKYCVLDFDWGQHYCYFFNWNKNISPYDVLNKWKPKLDTEGYSVPAGPDTTKFRASVSGEFKLVENEWYRGGYYEINRFHRFRFQVGGAIGMSDLPQEFWDDALSALTNEGKFYEDCFIHFTSGTNWSSVALAIR